MNLSFFKTVPVALLFVFCGLAPLCGYAQKPADPLFPNGFHIGLREEGYVINSLGIKPIYGSQRIISKPRLGSKAGLEVSYHFARYFGVSLGIDYGTTLHGGFDSVYVPLNIYHNYGFEGMPSITPINTDDVIRQFQIPVRIEFHFPMYNSNWMFCSAVGVNLVNVFESIGYAVTKRDNYNAFIQDMTFSIGIQKINEGVSTTLAEGVLSRPKEMTRKIEADLFLNLGVYYRLPYNDLIRFQAVFNYSFKDRMTGKYTYMALMPYEYGTISYRHNYIGLELAYIHCFKTKAQRAAAKGQ